MVGKVFNHWTVIERAPNNKSGDAMWLCECDCENHTRKIVKGASLRSGHSTSCGCVKKAKAAQIGHANACSLQGKKFGHLTVLEKAYTKNYKVFWKCECDCADHNIVYVSSDKLNSGHTQSCGCLTWNNLLGQHFGKLTVVEKTSERTYDGTIIWKCQCNCQSQNYIKASSRQLKNGTITHCGCDGHGSTGEIKIKQLLEKNNIPFQREYIFPSCKNPDTNQNLRFDFYVDNKYIIEYDGEQHFISGSGFFTEETVIDLQKRDNIKNQWCKNHKIPIIRIPYYHFDELSIEDLQLNTSNFILQE